MPSIRNTVRTSLLEVLQCGTTTNGEKLEACRLLLKATALGAKGKPRRKGFQKKADPKPEPAQDRIDEFLRHIY